MCVDEITSDGRSLLDTLVAGKVGRRVSRLSEFSGFRVVFLHFIAGAFEFQEYPADRPPSHDCNHFMAWRFSAWSRIGIRPTLDSHKIL